MSTAQPRPQTCPPVSSERLAQRGGARHQGAAVAVSGITNRSAEVRPGDLYVGVPGSRVHGARYAADAVTAGAVAVLTDEVGAALAGDVGVPMLVCDDVRQAVGSVAAAVYGDPSRRLQMLGITATSGKTTTAYLARAVLQQAGVTSGLIGTVETLIGDERVAHAAGASFTTPEAPDLQALLAVMLERGVTHVVMEVSSHSLQLGRVNGIEYAVAGFGNLSQDHLDFHHTMEEYFAAKALLFDGRSRVHVLNVDDPWVARLRDAGPRTVTISPSGAEADWSLSGHRVHGPDGITLDLRLSLPGEYNLANALLALALTAAAGFDPTPAVGALATVQVPGRMERVDAGQDFLALVDYSHKPAAVQAALASVRAQTSGRVLLVLGCGGDRDAGKRPVMGRVGAAGADLLVVTDDNPRSEDPAAIRAQMLAGTREVPEDERAEIVEIGDRAAAIRYAVRAAGAGDVVLVAGKGHETGQYVGGVVHEFDDRVEVRRALQERRS
ncbi:UDP-N-acetylmuramoyl-L-alanyl-D-glutamate--2,6-diaminopimelate ligase [Cumulibacter manganitolerans]|uniref:UDP-N-acetylmuramoyl-L-alanyl-D-glutamate--2, 6-diaminopimelate ligase n=1 Tax=Cumulibacter manganitolerans TaxID=1884992 RepID=UPI001294AF7C|nr:UDP-N-acetylmuramoyl-L-alanyl-D-glutamate--2,6-diaminopimelate ligase [Cumulibacter manganitolerans]